MEKPTHLKFISITVTNGRLYALDEAGIVWKYIPSTEVKDFNETMGRKGHYSFWSKLTSYRKQPGQGNG